MGRLARFRTHLLLFVAGLIVYGATASSRLKKQSSDPHFVLQADAWLNGNLNIPEWTQGADDPAKVETVELKDGRTVRGRRYKSLQQVTGVRWAQENSRLVWEQLFRVEGGNEVVASEIARTTTTTHYMSFPPFPSVLMLPQAAIHGRIANDVFMTMLIAALVLPLAFAALRRLVAAGLSTRTPSEDVWLVLALCFGTVFYFSAVQGRVWYTAHIVGIALALGYLWASIEAKHPIVAGVCLGCAALTRVPMAFMFPLFLFEAWRIGGGKANLRSIFKRCTIFAAPVLVLAAGAMIYNYARFGEPLEFGHIYLAVRQQENIETYGMFSHRYLSRNLAVAFALLPELSWSKPQVLINAHGLAIWFTTPILLALLWPRIKGPLHRPLWLTVVLVAVPTLFYHNSGWQQFGYRFSLDYMVLLFALLAVGARPLGRIGRALIVIAIVINLFGAATFARYNQFYENDSFDVVIKH